MTNTKRSITRIAMLLLAVTTGTAYAQISGHLTVCRGASRTILAGTPGGGVWSSGDVSHATIDATTGEVTGVAAGTATITYVDPTTAVHNAVVTVNSYVMSSIGFSMGSDTRCTGGVPASCTVSPMNGNNWTSSDPTIATVNTGGLVVPSATNSGTVTISYRHGYGNCYVTRDVSVNPTPTVSVTNPVCVGVTQTATGIPAGGTWSSSNTSVGTINSTTGVLSTFAGGGTYIRYTAGSCQSQTFLTVAAAPAAITGSTTVCVGNSATLSSASSGGTWSSSDPSVATIGSSSGIVAGVSIGTTTISYIVGSGCFRTVTVTVNAGPSASAGPDEVCTGQAISLTNATGGGSWSSSNTSRATVTTYGGTVVGVSAGTVNISYRVGGGCASVKTITVNATMAAISGGPNVCEGATVSLSHSMGGGTWAASNSHATVDATTGVVTGVTAGALNITYTASPGCVKAKAITVKSVPAAIAGTLTVCPGVTTALSSASGGGVWSSSNTSVATVSSYGVVSGVSGGTATITYTVTSWGCSTTAVVTVSSTGGSISGSTILCLGTGTTLTSSTTGGTWSSSNTAVATIGSSTGTVTSVSTGTTTISYNTGSGCLSAIILTVTATPSAISGANSVCLGATSTLGNSVGGGVWSSSNASVADVGSLSGVVSSVSVGTSVITYAVGGAACAVTAVVTVQPLPAAISGLFSVCSGADITLANATSGGSWSSANISIATVDIASGVVSGVSAGTVNIIYTLTTGCAAEKTITVNATPTPIIGYLGVCVGATSPLSSTPSGGSWSSSNSSSATIGSTDGVVAGISGGSPTISYDLSGCLTTTIVTVATAVSGISGTRAVCAGATSVLSATPAGGSWSSSNDAIGTVSSTGTLTGITPGTATITYSLGGTCYTTAIITVNVMPAALSGPSSVCVGSNITLSTSPSGGTWSSSASSRAAVGSGIVVGVSAGTATISYRMSSACFVTQIVTVNGVSAITGTLLCADSSVSLAVSPSGGTWSSTDPGVVSVSSTGFATATGTGTAIVSYVSPAGCAGSRTFTIDIAPTAITGGSDSVCSGSSFTLSESVTGGTWLSSNSAIATVDSSGYVNVIGLTPSTIQQIVISYRMPGGCAATRSIWVDETPDTSHFMAGPFSMTQGASISLQIGRRWTGVLMMPGVWSSGASSVASVGTGGTGGTGGNSPIIAGVSPGTATISFSASNRCGSHIYTRDIVVLAPACDNNWIGVGGSDREVDGNGDFGEYSRSCLGKDSHGKPLVMFDINAPSLFIGLNFLKHGVIMNYDGNRFIHLEHPEPENRHHDNSSTDFYMLGSDSSGAMYYGYNASYFDYPISSGTAFRKWDGLKWELYASHDAGAIQAAHVGRNGDIYKIYADPASGSRATVVRYDGSSWSVLGASGFSAQAVRCLSITSDAAGMPYCSFVSAVPAAGGGTTDSVFVFRYTGSAWSRVGMPFMNSTGSPSVGVTSTSLRVDAAGVPTVVYSRGSTGYVFAAQFTAGAWANLGTSGLVSDGNASGPKFAMDLSGTPYVVYKDLVNAGKTTVKKYQSGSWSTVGTVGFTPVASAQDIMVDNDGVPFVSCVESGFGNVWKFNGSAWESQVVNSVVTPYISQPVAMSVRSDTPFVCYGAGGKLSVRLLSGNKWVPVGAENFSSTSPSYVSMAMSSSSIYVAYSDASASNKATVMKFNGTSWSALGGIGISAGAVTFTDVAVDGSGTPYLVYKDVANGNKATVLKYTGSSWSAVGMAGFSPGQVSATSIAINSAGVPYVSFTDSTADGLASVMKYNGSAWEYVGAPGFGMPPTLQSYSWASPKVGQTWIKFDSTDVPYVGFWADNFVYVRRYDGTAWSSLSAGVELCRPIAVNQTATSVSFALSRSGTPYFAFRDGSRSGKLRLITFNGYDWVYSGPKEYGAEQYLTDESFADITVVTVAANGTPYLAQKSTLGPVYYNDWYYFNRQVLVKKLSENVVIGNRSLCVGGSVYLQPDRYMSGTWSSSNTSVATVGTNGIVSGVAAGTAVISYNYGTCAATAIVTVNSSVSAGSLSGSSSVVVGSSVSLSSTISGGVWSSSSASTATVGSSSGSVTGVAPGTVTITYAVTAACGLGVATHTVNVTASKPGSTAMEENANFSVYPNPSNGDIVVETTSTGQAAICGIDGRILKQFAVSAGVNPVTLPREITPGIYLLRFTGEDGTVQTTRLIYQP